VAEAPKKLVLLLSIEEGDVQHSFVEVKIPLPKGAEEREISDALQRGICNAFEVLKKEL
jgi:hypothetical protein